MTLIASLLIGVLALISLRVGRSLLYPPALYSAWLAIGRHFLPSVSEYAVNLCAWRNGLHLRRSVAPGLIAC
jgi:hypothetical protein